MVIGHLPGAYLAFKAFGRRIPPVVFAAAMVGSVLPDLDMLAFYFLDQRSFHHHEYITHRPVLWFSMVSIGLLAMQFSQSRVATIFVGLGAGGLVHMMLDSITGEIAWAWPLSSATFPLVTVQPTHGHWILSFLNHWTFQVEIFICALAAVVFFASRRAK